MRCPFPAQNSADQQARDGGDFLFHFLAMAEFLWRQAVWKQRVGAPDHGFRRGLGVFVIENAFLFPGFQDARHHLRFFLEVVLAPGQQVFPQGGEEVIQVFRVVADGVKAVQDADLQHLADLVRRGIVACHHALHAVQDPFGDPVDVRQRHLLLAPEMQVDGALADAHLPRQVLHRHLPETVPGQQDVDTVQDQLPDVFSLRYISHD